MKALRLFAVLILLAFFRQAIVAQEKLNVEGDAMINGNLTVDQGLSATSLFIDGNLVSNITSTGTSTLRLVGPNPMLELQRLSPSTPLAFIQAFNNDFFIANRLDGNLNFRTNNLTRMSINGSGDILLRTGTRLGEITLTHANGSGATNGVVVENTGNNDAYWTFYSSNTDGNLELYYQGQQRGEFNSTTGAYSTTSDLRLKKNIHPLNDVLQKVSDLKPSIFQYLNDTSGKDNLGFIAQEVQPIFPELVHQGKIGDSDEELYTLDYSGLGVVAIAAVQELLVQMKMENDELRESNQLLKEQLETISLRMVQLEARTFHGH